MEKSLENGQQLVHSEEKQPAQRRFILVPLFSSLSVVIIFGTFFVFSFYPHICEWIYKITERDLEPARWIFFIPAFVCFFFVVRCLMAWKTTRNKL